MNIRYLPFTRWWHWILGILLATGGLGAGAVVFLAKSPQENNCVSETPLDTASAVIYCATTTVDEQDSAKLSSSIRLLNTIPQDNPLRSNADNLIERWSQSIMHLSQKAFNEGDINRAVELALIIPDNHSASQTASEQIKTWRSIWSQAESIHAAALAEIDDDSKNWYAALNKAKQLQTLENEYWASTKYYELVRHIQGARENREKGDIEKKSASEKLQTDNSDNIVYDDKSDESTQLNIARKLANSGKLDDMRSALVEASMVISEPYVKDARKLMTETENKIAVLEDSTYLEEAKKLASKNDEISLKMAVNEAKLIGKERPLYKEANQQIATWEKKILQLDNQAIQTNNVSFKKAPIISNAKKTSTSKAPTSANAKFEVQNELKPILDNYNIKESLYPSIEKLEEMQMNYSGE
ncbi:hypothetical protein DSM106972_064540 [Dulcicalothrix desertica PCC 7102]|uniref:Chromosome segregation ATPase n=1 Tax=Dulcicalothrix desertica PCC 7102 TaxID=232991 RepID=A0A3S1ISW4_9CYAN|nr:hypothetical protein [Dulcicalothrix desertica]RUT01831.1 hypothetical protein DSM106972_064540 [Dulcicalothrix desertica PCC 7102]TWH42984.1 hypothetical protein CAL7102_06673 [Dulcicalothrix desertica PCC 7102]